MIALIITSMVLWFGGSNSQAKEFTIDIAGEDQVLEREIELPTLNCGSETKIEVRIRNKLNSKFKADQISTSCGCISKLTDSLDLPKEGSGSLSFVIAMPKSEESFTRYVTLSDLNLGRSVRIAVKCNAVPCIRIANARMDIEKEEITKFSIPIQAKPEIELRKLQVNLGGAEAVKGTVVVDSKGTGTLELVIDPKLAIDNSLQSSVSIEFVQDQKFVARSDLLLRYPNRTGLNPSTLSLNRTGDFWKGTIMIYSHRLHQDLKTNKQIKATLLVEGMADKASVTCSVRKTDSPACLVELSMPGKALDGMAGKRIAIRLESGDWHVDAPVQSIR